MAYYECLPTRLNPLAERTCFCQARSGAALEALDPAWHTLPGLTAEETFQLDCSGWLRVPAVLSAAEAAALRPGDGEDPLVDHPTMRKYLAAMCGADYRQDTRMATLRAPAPHAPVPLGACSTPDALWGREYFASNWGSPGLVVFRGVRAVYALGDAAAEVAGPAAARSPPPPLRKAYTFRCRRISA
jgi:hypothetical protein